MSRLSKRARLVAWACLLWSCAGWQGAGQATTYSMISDGDLFDQSAVVARVEVMAVSAAPAIGSPSTDYIVLVERLFKGRVGGTTIVVRVPGGVGPDGVGLEIHGAPEFEAGDRSLLFLSPRSDGTYGVEQLMLGAFHEVVGGDDRAALRRFDETRLLGDRGSGDTALVRDWTRFEAWLVDRGAGSTRAPDYFRPAGEGEMAAVGKPGDPAASTVRFFEFDDGGAVNWRLARGLPGSKKAFKRAAGAWSSDESTVVVLKRKKPTSGSNGFTRSDGVNAVIFGDPNREIEGAYSCRRGGILAVGGSWFLESPAMLLRIPRALGQGKARVAIEADIVVNDGAECLLAGNASAAASVFAHELGHTLGLGHPCDGWSCDERAREALMFPLFRDDGRYLSLIHI